MPLVRGKVIVVSGAGRACGKTALTLGIQRAFARRGAVASAVKVGMDPVDPSLHRLASGRDCHNIDSWAMRLETMAGLIDLAREDCDLLVVEGMDGLFDGEAGGVGSTADVASLLDVPVLACVTVGSADMAGISAIVADFEELARHRVDVEVAAAVFHALDRRVAATDLERILGERTSIPALGILHNDLLGRPNLRGLGPVTTATRSIAEARIERLGDLVERQIDLDRLLRIAREPGLDLLGPRPRPLAPLGQRIAVAQDEAFSLATPAVLAGWRRMGAEIHSFSPLADEAPDPAADAVYLPDGPVELFAGKLACNRNTIKGLHAASHRDAFVYGEGGGYLMLGELAHDTTGAPHAMTALLPVTTAKRDSAACWSRLELETRSPSGLGRKNTRFKGTAGTDAIEIERRGPPLFMARRAGGDEPFEFGSILATVAGSAARLIDRHMHLGIVRSRG